MQPRRARARELTQHAGEGIAAAEATHVACSHRGGIRGCAGQPLIILPVRRRNIRQRHVLQQCDSLRADARLRNQIAAEWLPRLRIIDRLLTGEVSHALQCVRHGSVVVEWRRRMIANEREKQKVLRVVHKQMRNVGRPREYRAETIRVVRRLRLVLASQCKILRIEQAVASLPEERAMRLVRVELPEVEASTAPPTPTAAKTTAAATSKTTTAATAITEAAESATRLPLPRNLRQRLLLLHVLQVVPHLVHIDAGKRIGRPALPVHRHGFGADVAVRCGRGQRCSAGLSSSRDCAQSASQQPQILRTLAAHILPRTLPISLCRSPPRFCLFHLLLTRSQKQSEIRSRHNCAAVQQHLFGGARKSCEIGTHYIATIRIDMQSEGAAAICGGYILPARQRVLRRHADARQRCLAGTNHSFDRPSARSRSRSRQRRLGDLRHRLNRGRLLWLCRRQALRPSAKRHGNDQSRQGSEYASSALGPGVEPWFMSL